MSDKVAARLRVLGGLERRFHDHVAWHERYAKEVSPVLLPRARQERDLVADDMREALECIKIQRVILERNATLEAENLRLQSEVGQATEQVKSDSQLLKDCEAALRVLRTVLRHHNLKTGAEASDALYRRISARWMRGGIIQLVKERIGEKAAIQLRSSYPPPGEGDNEDVQG